jgi:hypothetical protein
LQVAVAVAMEQAAVVVQADFVQLLLLVVAHLALLNLLCH